MNDVIIGKQRGGRPPVLLGASKEATFPSFSSGSSLDDMVPVEEVRAILLMSPKTYKTITHSYSTAGDGGRHRDRETDRESLT